MPIPFLDKLKAFDQVWHQDVLYKLKLLRICCRYYSLTQPFLNNRQIVLNGQSPKQSLIEVGVPQGSILGPLLFRVYINDLAQGLRCDGKVFADDSSIFSTISSPLISSPNLNEDLLKTTPWDHQWKMSFNADITIVARNEQSGNTGHLNRNLYVILKFTERPKTLQITSKITWLSLQGISCLQVIFVQIWMKQTLIWFSLQRDGTRNRLSNIKDTFAESLQLQMSVLHQSMCIFKAGL